MVISGGGTLREGGGRRAVAAGARPAGGGAVWRAARLEMLLGDPWQGGGAHGLDALAAAGRPPAATVELLRLAGTGSERVTAEHGGYFTTAEQYVRALRPVLRRDVALGHAVGIAPLRLPQAGVPDALRRPGAAGVLAAAAVSAAAATVLRAAAGQVAARGAPARQWHSVLAVLFAELLACESLTAVALRALGGPGGAPVLCALTGYLVPHLVGEGLEDLELVLNENGCPPLSAPRRALDKLGSDLPGAGAGPRDTARRLARLVAALPALADAAGRGEYAADAALFRLGDPTDVPTDAAAGTPPPTAPPPATPPDPAAFPAPPLLPPAHSAAPAHLAHPGEFSGFSGGAAGVGADGVLPATLAGAAARLAGAGGEGPAALGGVARRLVSEQRALLAPCRTTPAPAAIGALGGAGGVDPVACALADRQALLALAGAVLGVREAAVAGGARGFLAGAGWAFVALSRITERLGVPLPPSGAAGAADSVWAELAARIQQGRDVDVHATPLPW